MSCSFTSSPLFSPSRSLAPSSFTLDSKEPVAPHRLSTGSGFLGNVGTSLLFLLPPSLFLALIYSLLSSRSVPPTLPNLYPPPSLPLSLTLFISCSLTLTQSFFYFSLYRLPLKIFYALFLLLPSGLGFTPFPTTRSDYSRPFLLARRFISFWSTLLCNLFLTFPRWRVSFSVVLFLFLFSCSCSLQSSNIFILCFFIFFNALVRLYYAFPFFYDAHSDTCPFSH